MIGHLVYVMTTMLRPRLDMGVCKQDVLVALAAVSAWVIQREPKHIQDDLDDFVSPAIEALLGEDDHE